MISLDPLTKEERSERMSRVRACDTKPEVLVRRLVFSMGYRYRLHRKDLPGKPDLVFSSRRKIVFVHGCFWHRHNCPNGNRLPKTRLEFWKPKLETNRHRDSVNRRRLRGLGWDVLTVWECETRDTAPLAAKLRRFLEGDPGNQTSS